MPLMPKKMLECIAFIYASRKDAEKDLGFSATGFVVSYPSTVKGRWHNYIVTNYHVVSGLKNLAIRLNTGAAAEISEPPKKYWSIDKKNDIAILPFTEDKPADPSGCLQLSFVPIDMFLTKEKFEKHKIGAGDELFLVSRYQRQGIRYERNNPLMRFGNLAMSPTEKEPYFTIELRSVGGHSGSPVFVYDLPFSYPETRSKDEKFLCYLLGIDLGHVVDYGPLVAVDPITGRKVEHPKWLAESHVALAQVTPAWDILNLLECDVLKARRKHGDAIARQLDMPDFKHD